MQSFFVSSEKIENRIDPHFYRPEFIGFYDKLEQTKFEFKTIGEISEKVTSGATPLSKGDAYTSKEEGIPFIRSGDINENKNINFDEILYIKKDIHEKKLKGSKLKKGDVLIAIVGATIGQVSIYDYDREANINQAIALVRLNKKVNPDYVKAFMISTLGQNQLDRIKRPVARANINLDEIRGINIILPPLEIQNEIVSSIDNAYKEQKNKYKKISKFLDSINDYFLDELGIKVPEFEEKNCFTVNSNDIRKRMDCSYHKSNLAYLREQLMKLKSIDLMSIASFQYGLPETSQEEGDIHYIRISDIDEFGNLKKKGLKYLTYLPKYDAFKLKKGDLLVARTGATFGKSYLFEETFDAVFAGYLIRISITSNDLNAKFLFYFMQTQLYWLQAKQLMTGGGQPQFNANTIGKLLIPIPSKEIQNEIVQEVTKRRQVAKQLQKEAKEELEKTKQEVERIILGV